MKIREGVYYRMFNGDVVGPMRRKPKKDEFPWFCNADEWRENGCHDYYGSDHELMSEVYVIDTPPADALRAEVERLKAGGCARDQGTTQFCAEAVALQAEKAKLREALHNLVSYVDLNECHHENTHRGGSIWTICSECGAKWADDEGGFRPYCEPTVVTAARAALERKK
jgi:hypothetical protein